MPEVLYRYEDKLRSVGGFDVHGDYEHAYYDVDLIFREYLIEKHTKCGVWINMPFYPYKKRFINLTAKKKFACLTKQEALESFIKRKIRQIKILKQQLSGAEKAYRMALYKEEKLQV